MIYLITGCAGFIGSHLCKKILEDKINIVYGIDILNEYYDVNQKLDNLSKLKKYNNFHFFKDDLVSTTLISQVYPNIVIHLGAMAGVRNSILNPEIYMRINVEGTIHLLNESVKNNVSMFIYASSSSVYGNNKKIPFNENDSLTSIISPYALSKKTCEDIAFLYNKLYKIKTFGLRFFTVYGPSGRPDMFPYKCLHSIINNIPVNKYGDGTSARDYTYIDDIINGIIGVIRNKNNKKCEVYNLGNNNPVLLNDFISICEKITNKTVLINQMEKQDVM
jgi:UDP-glucuronate 4-epimerase